ncbi:DnaJ domain [Moorella glycerini]|uniref:Chaperone protein DnaJ n=1 Tax=Neomoorella stamsii TaxID=1266720 RepID=A0A9X7J3A1_9FIRM|nr:MULTISPECIES: J domain-containing protein [Moorella]PRR72321.1 Chaperone protein DnaJ [Moorella stamsii]CEP68868.1 DnaJ domain [Moorella glycerini]
MKPTPGNGDPYQILGLEPGASAAAIKRAYLQLVRRHPPEQQPEEFKRIRAAYEQLKDARARAKTDLGLFHLDTGRLARKLGPLRWPGRSIIQYAPGELLTCCGDLGRTDFHDDYKEQITKDGN